MVNLLIRFAWLFYAAASTKMVWTKKEIKANRLEKRRLRRRWSSVWLFTGWKW